ncbi:MAG: extracellular solute-binding protein [Thermotogota bacterium]|nr:extracellular solute-binding protein [Thermotogota bacterium]
MFSKKCLVSVFIVVLMCFVGSVFAEDFEWVTPNRIGHPDAEIVLTAALRRGETVANPYDSSREYVKKAATEWAKAHPNVRIDIQQIPVGAISMMMAKIMTQAANGNAPDFAYIDSFWIGKYLANGYLQPLNDYMSEADINAFFPFIRDVVSKEGQMYAIWCETDARYLYYRKDWIPNPPRTWDEVIETALQMKEEKHVNGYLAWLATWEGATNGNVWPSFWAQGGQMFDETGRPVIGEGKNKTALVNSLNFLKRLIKTGAAPMMVTSIDSTDPLITEVKCNNVAMVANGSWFIGQIRDVLGKEEADEKWDFVPLPQMEAGQRSNSNGGWTYAVLTDDPVKQELAMSYIMAVVGSRDAMAERCKAMNNIPTRSDVYETDPYFSTDPTMLKFAESLNYGNARPAHPLYMNVSDLVQKALGKLLIGQESDTEKLVDEIQEKALELWEESK